MATLRINGARNLLPGDYLLITDTVVTEGWHDAAAHGSKPTTASAATRTAKTPPIPSSDDGPTHLTPCRRLTDLAWSATPRPTSAPPATAAGAARRRVPAAVGAPHHAARHLYRSTTHSPNPSAVDTHGR